MRSCFDEAQILLVLAFCNPCPEQRQRQGHLSTTLQLADSERVLVNVCEDGEVPLYRRETCAQVSCFPVVFPVPAVTEVAQDRKLEPSDRKFGQAPPVQPLSALTECDTAERDLDRPAPSILIYRQVVADLGRQCFVPWL